MAMRSTLGALVLELGLGLLDVVEAPKGLDVEVGEPVVFDPLDDAPLHGGDLLLAVGLDERRPELVDLIHRAGGAGGAAVVAKFRANGPSRPVLDAAREAGVALVRAVNQIEWGQLLGLLRAALVAGGEPIGESNDGIVSGDLFALANAVAAMVGGPVTIEDPQSRVLAYAHSGFRIDDYRKDTILGRRIPEDWVRRLRDDGVFRRLWSSDDVVVIDYAAEHPDYRRRLAIAVRAGTEVVGSIWVQEDEHPLGPEAEAALREAARIAALHLLRSRSNDDLERRRRTERLRAALDDRAGPEDLAAALGVTPTTPVTVVAFAVPGEDDAEVSMRGDRLSSLVSVYAEAYRLRVGCVVDGRVVYVVVAAKGGMSARTFAVDVVARARESLRFTLRAALGSTVPNLSDVATPRHEADEVLRVLDFDGREGVAAIEEVRGAVLLNRLRDLARRDPSLLEGKLDVLREHDRRRGSAFVPTLHAYLDAVGDTPAAAARLGVHVNTFRYRLRRALELSGLDLADPTDRLIAHVQLELLKAVETP